ncbi:MAG: DUF262 domain-containing HNH endonuclease family protein [Candidatus Nealsonbacteria bacterium]
MKIESRDQNIRTLLSSGYYQIPRFQRPYSWDRENIQEFWDDIIQEKPEDYFIGSMVIYKKAKQIFGVVDGQQRLTTVTILLCVLRNVFKKESLNDQAKGIHSLVERKNINNKSQFILSTETSYPFFQHYIQAWGDPNLEIEPLTEELNLERAYEQLQKLIEGMTTSIKSDTSLTTEKKIEKLTKRLSDIRDQLLDLNLILIELDNEDDAYIIFETLNTRGKDLSITDLVKNHLTKYLKSKNEENDPTKIRWKDMMGVIQGASSEIDSDTFIHHFWLSKFDFLTVKKLFKSIKNQIKEKEAEQFLIDLVNDSRLYRCIHETSFRNWEKQEQRIKEALEALVLFRVKQQTPCVMSLVREYNNGKIKKTHLEEALIAIENFHFLFTAITSQRSSGGISSMYASLGRRFFQANDTQEAVKIIKDLKKKFRDRIPSLKEFNALFPEVVYTQNQTKQRGLIKYILSRVDKHTRKNATIDYEQMTIEHILPQDKIGSNGLTDETIGQIGNLVLVTEKTNGKLKNKTFDEKKEILLKDGIGLPSEIKNIKKWGKKEIEERTLEIAKKAYKTIWKI